MQGLISPFGSQSRKDSRITYFPQKVGQYSLCHVLLAKKTIISKDPLNHASWNRGNCGIFQSASKKSFLVCLSSVFLSLSKGQGRLEPFPYFFLLSAALYKSIHVQLSTYVASAVQYGKTLPLLSPPPLRKKGPKRTFSHHHSASARGPRPVNRLILASPQ